MKNIRTCIACRKKFNKEQAELFKITKVNGELLLNDGNYFGRSYYICKNDECLKKVIKNKIFNKICKTKVNDDIYEKLNSLKGQ